MFRNRRAVGVACALVLWGLAVAVRPVAAQVQPPAAPADHVHPAPADDGVAPQVHQHEAAAVSLFPPRDVSGTAWQPDETPMRGFHFTTWGWEVMLHGNAFVQLFHESAPEHRGATQAGSINWFMGMARRPLGGGRFGVRAMLSAEPWTIAGCGYPDLLATGEVCDGDTIHDLQHPHDLLMELAVDWRLPVVFFAEGGGGRPK